MSKPTPLNEFKELLPENHTLREDQIEFFRDLIDAQANLILDSFMAEKAKESKTSSDTIN
jgi:hypothetical protein